MSDPADRHPLPDSDEARHGELPETAEREKGRGDDDERAVQPRQPAANPDGEPYPSAGDAFQQDRRDHQDRGQGDIATDHA